MTTRDVVICEPVRTPVGRYGGSLRDVPAHTLAAGLIRSLLERTGVPPESVDDVLLGQCYPSADAPALGRVAALDAGLPVEASGLQIDRRCGSGLQAVIYAVLQVGAGASDLVLAGGAESMSRAPFFSSDMRWGAQGDGVMLHDALSRGRVTAGGAFHPVPGGMVETAENLRAEYGISRERQDAFALRSHQRAVAAQESGAFRDEIVPVRVRDRKGVEHVVDTDEHPRADASADSLAQLPALRRSVDPAATVTAGNASGQNDGAAVCVVTTRDRADSLGLRPFGRLASWGLAGVPPRTMGIGPVPATARALQALDLGLADVGLIELNEAFASQVLAVTAEWGIADDDERLNVHGSGISLGHPVGATGGRILATMLWEMRRRSARYGLETMCIGGGQGLAAIFESVS
jgi:acetyl-CoA C-acetyltransferase